MGKDMSQFKAKQRIRVNGKLATVIESNLPDQFGGTNNVKYQLDGSNSVIQDNPAIAAVYSNRIFEAA